ncbi:hypothetical protein VWD94_08195 [Staphylococcus aureus]
MQKSKAIKELFKIQDNENKFKIIKNYDLKIKGFSNITLDFIEQNEKYISNQIATTQNIKKITNIIKNKKKMSKTWIIYCPLIRFLKNITKILMA